MSKKNDKLKTIAFVICAVFMVTTVISAYTKADTALAVNSNNDTSISLVPVLLTDNQVQVEYPNLPTADQLWGNSPWVDTSKRTEPLINCTVNLPSTMNGEVLSNVPEIWLQYNSTIYVEVPLSDLNYTQTTITSQNPSASPQSNPASWAIRSRSQSSRYFRVKPSHRCRNICRVQLTGSASNDWVGTVLSINDGVYAYQIEIEDVTDYGHYVNAEQWSDSAGKVVNTEIGSVTANNDQMYSEYIQYNTNENDWQFMFNQYTQWWTCPADGETGVLTGAQPTVCIESNDFTPSNFTSFAKTAGETYYNCGNGTDIYIPAIGYQYNNEEQTPDNWHPYYERISNSNPTSDPVPKAEVYEGGSAVSAWPTLLDSVSFEGPPSSLDVGIQNPAAYTEILQFGHGYSDPSTGTKLW